MNNAAKIITDDPLKFKWSDLIRSLYFLLDKKRAAYLTYTIILALVLFYDLLPTFVIGRVVDFFTNYSSGQSLYTFYFYVILLTVTWAIVAFIRLTVKKRLTNIQADTAYFTRVRGFERLLDFSISWHDKENTGNKVQRINAGADTLKQLQAILSNDLLSQVTGITGVLIAFTILKPVFLVYSLIYITIFLIVQFSFYRKMLEMNNEQNKLLEKAGGTYYEGLSNLLTIKALGAKDDFKKNVISREELTRDYSKRRITMMNNKWKSFQIINALSIGGVLFLAGQNYLSSAISLGSIFVIYNYFQKLNGSISQSTDSLERLVNVKVTIARMMPIFWSDTKFVSGNYDFPQNWQTIELKNAFFAYQKQNEDYTESGIKDVSVVIPRGQKLGVVGMSGSGKSTLAKILIGLYPLQKGEFKIGNLNFADIKHDGAVGSISLVLQDSEMFNLSLKENITLMRKFNEKLFEQAISIAQLNDVITKLPDGVETLIGEKGYRLSGGERQRIGIARAIYKNADILILDEATSALDSRTEKNIQEAFEASLKDKTVISIAHRVSTLKTADKIVVFDGGRIVEEGSYASLSEKETSKFNEIYKHQLATNVVSSNQA